jgi:hypothetical protein
MTLPRIGVCDSAARASLSVGLSNRIDSMPSLRRQRGHDRFVMIAVAAS